MFRRIVTAHQRPLLLRRPLGACERRWATTTATNAAQKEAAAGAAPSAASSSSSSAAANAASAGGGRASGEVAHAAAQKATADGAHAASDAAASKAVPRGPHRKDWRTHKDVVYVKGVPAKGSMFKLPFSEQFIIYLVFSLAGAGAVYLVRPQIRYLCHHGFLGLTEESGWVNGPWLYRLIYVLIMFPCYSAILFTVGSFFGRRIWFSFMIHKMWSRFLTKKASTRLAHILDIQHY